MRKPSLVALLSALSLARGSATNGSENDGSGDGSPILSTVTVTTPPATHSLVADDQGPVPVTASATESSFETKSTPSTELNATSNQDSLEAVEHSILRYVVPVVLLVLLILLIMFFVIHHKRKKSKQDELGSENVKSRDSSGIAAVVLRSGIPRTACDVPASPTCAQVQHLTTAPLHQFAAVSFTPIGLASSQLRLLG
ncbi:transmembrane protein 154 isoform 1-T1 [Alca torda]